MLQALEAAERNHNVGKANVPMSVQASSFSTSSSSLALPSGGAFVASDAGWTTAAARTVTAAAITGMMLPSSSSSSLPAPLSASASASAAEQPGDHGRDGSLESVCFTTTVIPARRGGGSESKAQPKITDTFRRSSSSSMSSTSSVFASLVAGGTDPTSPALSDRDVAAFQDAVKEFNHRPGASRAALDPATALTWVFPQSPTPREYQFNIARTCLLHNSLVVLPTGLGKVTNV